MKQTESKITYTERERFFYPDLAIPAQTEYPAAITGRGGLTV